MSSATANAPGYGDGRIGALVQAAVLGTLLAGAGLLAITAGSAAGGGSPDNEFTGHAPPAAAPGLVVVAPPAPRLLVVMLVESEQRAAAIRAGGLTLTLPDGRPAEGVTFDVAVVAGFAGEAAFAAAHFEAERVCQYEQCPHVRTLDLRPPR